jgi:hypothetical protein
VLWAKEGDAWWIARNAPMSVLLRAGDLLRIPRVDYYNQIALAAEATRAARNTVATNLEAAGPTSLVHVLPETRATVATPIVRPARGQALRVPATWQRSVAPTSEVGVLA